MGHTQHGYSLCPQRTLGYRIQLRLHETHILGIPQFAVPILQGFSSNSPGFLTWLGRSIAALHLIVLSFLQSKSECSGHQVYSKFPL